MHEKRNNAKNLREPIAYWLRDCIKLVLAAHPPFGGHDSSDVSLLCTAAVSCNQEALTYPILFWESPLSKETHGETEEEVGFK